MFTILRVSVRDQKESEIIVVDRELFGKNGKNNDETVITLLQDILAHCEEDDYNAVLAIIRTKFDNLKKPLSPHSEFLRLRLPNLGRKTIESDEDFDQFRLKIIRDGARANIPEAEYHFACHLYEEKKYSDAMRLYKSSAISGYPPSQHCYGLDLFHGIGENKGEQKRRLEISELSGRKVVYSIN